VTQLQETVQEALELSKRLGKTVVVFADSSVASDYFAVCTASAAIMEPSAGLSTVAVVEPDGRIDKIRKYHLPDWTVAQLEEEEFEAWFPADAPSTPSSGEGARV
jgi:predicted amidohydrolase